MRRLTATVSTALLTGAAIVLAAGSADARSVAMSVRATATCAPRTVNVKLTDGSVAAVRHATPGRTITTVRAGTKDLYLVVRLKASWKAVQRRPGQHVLVTADGPNGEQWQFTYLLRKARPLADPTRYTVCLRPRTLKGSFAKRMRAVKGTWTFGVAITEGSLVGTSRSLDITVK